MVKALTSLTQLTRHHQTQSISTFPKCQTAMRSRAKQRACLWWFVNFAYFSHLFHVLCIFNAFPVSFGSLWTCLSLSRTAHVRRALWRRCLQDWQCFRVPWCGRESCISAHSFRLIGIEFMSYDIWFHWFHLNHLSVFPVVGRDWETPGFLKMASIMRLAARCGLLHHDIARVLLLLQIQLSLCSWLSL